MPRLGDIDGDAVRRHARADGLFGALDGRESFLHQIHMPQVRQEELTARGDILMLRDMMELLLQLGHAAAVASGDRHDRNIPGECFHVSRLDLLRQVILIQDDKRLSSAKRGEQCAVLFRERARAVDDCHNEVSLLHGLLRALDADALDLVLRLTDAGCIHQDERHTADLDGLLDGVARRPGNIRHDGPLLLQKRIQKARFPCIRAAHDRRAQAIADDAPLFGAREQRPKR